MISKIEACRICGNINLVPIFDLGSQNLGSRFPTESEPDPILAPLILVKCHSDDEESCGLLQLLHNVSGEELYLHHYGYRSGLNNTMTQHLRNLVQEIENQIDLQPGMLVVDIGSNDSTLLQAYTRPGIIRVGIDPTGHQFRQFYPPEINLIPDFFAKSVFEDRYPGQKANVITSICMFYDLPDPIAFASDLKSILAPDGLWISEQSYCPTMIDRNSFDTICHEHLEYYMLKQFDYIAEKVGLKVLDVSFNDCNGGSFRVTLDHAESSRVPQTSKLDDIRKQELGYDFGYLSEFVDRCKNMKEEFLNFLHQNSNKTVYLYGASTKGNTLLQYYGLDHTRIKAAAERNPEKYGRRTPGTNIPIVPEAEMREKMPEILLVLPWHFKEEFLQREENYLKQGGTIVFPLPQLEICQKK